MADFPGGTPSRRAARPRRAGPARLPREPRRARRVGELARAGPPRDRRDTPGPAPTAGSSASADGSPQGTLHEGAARPPRALLPPDDRRRCWTGRCSAAQAYLHRRGITAWQDAWVTPDRPRGVRAGRSDAGSSPDACVPPSGGTGTRGLEQIAELIERRDGRDARPGRRRHREDHGRRRPREPHRRDARAVPRCRRVARRPTRGLAFVPPRARSPRPSSASTRPGSRSTSTRSATGPSATRSTRSRRRSRRTAARQPPPHRPHPGRPPGGRPAVRRARGDRQHAAVLGLPRRPDGRPHHPVPRAGADAGGSTRSRRWCVPAPGWPAAATGR